MKEKKKVPWKGLFFFFFFFGNIAGFFDFSEEEKSLEKREREREREREKTMTKLLGTGGLEVERPRAGED